MEEHGAFWALDMSTAVPCFPTWFPTWPSAHRLRTNHSTDGHGIKGGGAPYMHIRTEVCKSKEEKPQTLRKQTYLGSVDQNQKKG